MKVISWIVLALSGLAVLFLLSDSTVARGLTWPDLYFLIFVGLVSAQSIYIIRLPKS